MIFNKTFIKKWIKNGSSLFNITNLFIFLIFITGLYLINDNFNLIEGNEKLKDKGNDEDGAKNDAENSYTVSDEVLPPSDHITRGHKL